MPDLKGNHRTRGDNTMASLMRGGILPRGGSAWTLAACLSLGSWAMTFAGDPVPSGPVRVGVPGSVSGNPGFPGMGLLPDFQGFGLSYHLGYGYGGNAVGVGANGGYPFYGGPGYPHGTPRLRRFGPITPLPYYGGPGILCDGPPFFFAPVGPLSVDQPVAHENNGSDHGYGEMTGAIPYPDTLFAPYASPIMPTGSSSEASPPSASGSPAPGEVDSVQAKIPDCGFDEESTRDADGVRGIKVSRVHPGTAAEKAGLEAGDVIRSVNGFQTKERGNLAWIVSEARRSGRSSR